jgi:hypothetical protein
VTISLGLDPTGEEDRLGPIRLHLSNLREFGVIISAGELKQARVFIAAPNIGEIG